MPHRISGQQDPNLSHLKDLERYKSVMTQSQLELYNRYQSDKNILMKEQLDYNIRVFMSYKKI